MADITGLLLADGPSRLCLWFNRARTDQPVTLPPASPGMAWHLMADSADRFIDADLKGIVPSPP